MSQRRKSVRSPRGKRGGGPRGATRPAVALEVPGRPEFLSILRDVSGRIAELAGFRGAEARELAGDVEEAARRAMRGVVRGTDQASVELRLEYRGSEFRAELVDNGAGRPSRLVRRKRGAS